MLNNESRATCGILYVDDEEKALKYFRMAFASKYEVFTATSGREGLEVLEREKARIGIVLSDQRMPEMLGAEFLGRVRKAAPQAVRILTTAFSDLDSAIHAVNEGHIYQYVVKPWEVHDLGMVLQRAADYHHVLAERDSLLSLKMSTLQRVLCSDRLKWLLLLSESMAADRKSAIRAALAAMIRAMPDDLLSVAAEGAFNLRQFEMPQLVASEYQNASRCAQWLAADAPIPTSEENGRRVLDAAAAGETNLRNWFGLLVEREVPEISVRLLQTIAAVASAKSSLMLRLSTAGGGAGADGIEFHPEGDAPEPESLIRDLYDKYAEADIARM